MKLDNDQIEALLKKPEKAPPRSRKKSNNYTRRSTRTYTVWFTLEHRLGICANPDCSDPRPMRTKDGNAMVVSVGEVTMCRYCFLDGFMVTDET